MATPPGPLLNVRAALLLLISGVVGLVAGVMGYRAYGGLAEGVLVGGGAAGAGLALFHSLLDP